MPTNPSQQNCSLSNARLRAFSSSNPLLSDEGAQDKGYGNYEMNRALGFDGHLLLFYSL